MLSLLVPKNPSEGKATVALIGRRGNDGCSKEGCSNNPAILTDLHTGLMHTGNTPALAHMFLGVIGLVCATVLIWRPEDNLLVLEPQLSTLRTGSLCLCSIHTIGLQVSVDSPRYAPP